MKRIVSLILCAVLLLSFVPASFAEETATELDARLIRVEEDEGIKQYLLVSGISGNITKGRVTLSVLREGMLPGTPLSDELSFEDKYAAMHQGYIDGGSFEFNIPFDEDEGSYTVYVNMNGELLSSEITCYPIGTLVELLSALNGKTATVSYVADALINHGEKLGVDTSVLKYLEEATVKVIAERIIEAAPEKYSIDNLNSLLSYYVMVEGLINSDKADTKRMIIEKYEEELKPEEICVWDKYLAMSSELQEKVLSYLSGKEAENEEDLRNLLQDGIAFIAFSSLSNYSEVEDYYSGYEEALPEAEVSKLTAMSSKEKSVIAVHIIKNKKNVKTAEDISDVLNDAIKNVSKLLAAAGSSSGSSGGGGGGGGRVSSDKEISVKKEEITKPEVITPATPETTGFSDISDASWAKDSILYLLERNIVNGKEINRFAPNDTVKRSEFAKMVAIAFGYEKNKEHSFKDVNNSHWANDYISAVSGVGVIMGDNEGNFRPDADITRQDIATILYRIMLLKNHKFDIESVKLNFADKDDISEYAVNGMAVLSHMEVMTGYEDGTAKPLNNATRAEVSVLVSKVMKILEGEK